MTALWDLPDFDDHEEVVMVTDTQSGLRAIIAIHSTHLGPGAGGTRFWHYTDGDAAITDALRLSRGMSFKNAMAGLPLGGGKGVILAPADRSKSPALLAAYARAIERLGGRYVTAEDVGMSEADMAAIARETRYVSGLPGEAASAGGDPGPFTGKGVFWGIEAAARHRLGQPLSDCRVAIQGVGSVGGTVARLLADAGADLVVADVNAPAVERIVSETGASPVSIEDIMSVEADIFSPNALGAILNEHTIPGIKARVVAGGANNQLARPEHARMLTDRGILYAPDYVINAGGIINVGLEYLERASVERVWEKIGEIPERLVAIWNESEKSGNTPAEVADRMAMKLIGRG